MAKAHHRPKEPEQVRAALLDGARRMVAEAGIAALSVQAVADAAGVTKGAFFHHFANKAALVDAVFTELFEAFDQEIDRSIAADPDRPGCFTRAYVGTVFRTDERHRSPPLAGLWISAMADGDIRARWRAWLEGRLARHSATDADPRLDLVRFAADGVWLADILRLDTGDRAALRERLIRQTRLET